MASYLRSCVSNKFIKFGWRYTESELIQEFSGAKTVDNVITPRPREKYSFIQSVFKRHNKAVKRKNHHERYSEPVNVTVIRDRGLVYISLDIECILDWEDLSWDICCDCNSSNIKWMFKDCIEVFTYSLFTELHSKQWWKVKTGCVEALEFHSRKYNHYTYVIALCAYPNDTTRIYNNLCDFALVSIYN